jgi:hypothetical protein
MPDQSNRAEGFECNCGTWLEDGRDANGTVHDCPWLDRSHREAARLHGVIKDIAHHLMNGQSDLALDTCQQELARW